MQLSAHAHVRKQTLKGIGLCCMQSFLMFFLLLFISSKLKFKKKKKKKKKNPNSERCLCKVGLVSKQECFIINYFTNMKRNTLLYNHPTRQTSFVGGCTVFTLSIRLYVSVRDTLVFYPNILKNAVMASVRTSFHDTLVVS